MQRQLTEAQILFGIRSILRDKCDCDRPFDAETRIDTYLKDCQAGDVDLADIYWNIERAFGFTASKDEWSSLTGSWRPAMGLEVWEQRIGPRFTFGALMKIVRDRAPVLAVFDPVDVIGTPCATAGAFYGIRDLARQTMGHDLAFPPSASIEEVMSGSRLRSFWSRLRWVTMNGVPDLTYRFARAADAAGITALLGLVGMIATCAAGGAGLVPVWLPVGFGSLAALAGLCAKYLYRDVRLPEGISTFRDVARMIVQAREQPAI